MIGENLLGPEPTRLAPEPQVASALAAGETPEQVARTHPESPLAWALLADEAHAAGRDIESYAYARVGYHRGLDTLRKSGWRGAGPIPWEHEPNRGFLRCLHALARAAALIGEEEEATRCTLFLRDSSAAAADALEGR